MSKEPIKDFYGRPYTQLNEKKEPTSQSLTTEPTPYIQNDYIDAIFSDQVLEALRQKNDILRDKIKFLISQAEQQGFKKGFQYYMNNICKEKVKITISDKDFSAINKETK